MRTPALLSTIVMTLSAASSSRAQPEQSWELPEESWEQPADVSPDQEGFVALVHPDGSVTFRDRSGKLIPLGATFDITDMIMRSRGEDPYASQKLRFLDATRDARVALGRDYRRELYARSAATMQENIDTVWRTVPDAAQRKQLVFELWDECAETGNPELVEGASAARAQLVWFVRRYMTGADGYTPSELARFNARRTSTAEFDPYDERETRVATTTASRG